MSNSARETFIDWLAVAVGGVLAFAVAGAIGLLVSIRATRELEHVDTRLRLAESKLSDMAFVYRCDECQTTMISDWHSPTTCRACGNQRRFCFVGVHDPNVSRGDGR